MKRIIHFTLLIFFCACVGKLWYWARDGFSLNRLGVWVDGKEEPFSEEGREALSKTYYYLSRGRQSFAFVSDDGLYILKLPRMDRYRLPFWLKSIPWPSSYREELREHRRKGEEFIRDSFFLSYQELREQTALVGIHLTRTENRGEAIRCVDRIGREFQLPVHCTAFAVQRRENLLMPAVAEALDKGNREAADRMLAAFLDVIAERARKGILNRDPNFYDNFGFDGERAYQIDIGSFYRVEGVSQNELYQNSVIRTVEHVSKWLEERDQEMFKQFEVRLEPLLKETL